MKGFWGGWSSTTPEIESSKWRKSAFRFCAVESSYVGKFSRKGDDFMPFIFQNASKEGQIGLKDDLSSYYAPGTKVILSRDDLNFDSVQTGTLQTISNFN